MTIINQPMKGKKRRRSFYEWVMLKTGTGTRGNDGNPPEPKSLRYRMVGKKLKKLDNLQVRLIQVTGGDYQVFTSNNDGMELWFGYSNHWNHSLSSRETRALFWYLLWDWYIKARWLGLRRPIYYWALHKHIKRYK